MNIDTERLITHNLCSVIFDDVEKIAKEHKDIVSIIKKLAYKTDTRESNILANYSHLKICDNKIYVYDKEDSCFYINYN